MDLVASTDASELDPAGHVFSHPNFRGHEAVLFANDAKSGLRTIIALHSSALGTSLGGCRMWPYQSEEEALSDVLRLSEGMTYKAAAAGLPFGGGKMVIIGDPQTQKTQELFEAAGAAIHRLGGNYITGEDVGTTVPDMVYISRATPYVMGLPQEMGGSGDPSPSTAFGCFIGILAAVKHRLGQDDLTGVRIAVQGLGNVGWRLCEHLSKARARLLVSDIRKDVASRAVEAFSAQRVHPDAIHSADVEIFSPCALGNSISTPTVPEIRAKIVAGAANNQLESPELADALRKREILYAPDFVINGGGMIQLASERTGWNADELRRRLVAIGDTLTSIFIWADERQVSTLEAATSLVEQRLSEAESSRAEEAS